MCRDLLHEVGLCSCGGWLDKSKSVGQAVRKGRSLANWDPQSGAESPSTQVVLRREGSERRDRLQTLNICLKGVFKTPSKGLPTD